MPLLASSQAFDHLLAQNGTCPKITLQQGTIKHERHPAGHSVRILSSA